MPSTMRMLPACLLMLALAACGGQTAAPVAPSAATASAAGPANASAAAPRASAASVAAKPAAGSAAASGKPLTKLVQALPAVNFGTILPGKVADAEGYFRDEGLELTT